MTALEASWLCSKGHDCATRIMTVLEASWLCQKHHDYARSVMTLLEGSRLCSKDHDYARRIMTQCLSFGAAGPSRIINFVRRETRVSFLIGQVSYVHGALNDRWIDWFDGFDRFDIRKHANKSKTLLFWRIEPNVPRFVWIGVRSEQIPGQSV